VRVIRRSSALVAIALAAWCLAAAPADNVVLRVGQTAFTRGEVQAWLSRTSLVAKADGAPAEPGATRRHALLQMALLTEHGRVEQGHSGESEARDTALVAALDRAIRAEQAPTDAEISAFYDAHKDRYVEPKAIRMWRILVADEAVAKNIIAKVDGDPKAVYLWGDFTREHSVDEATKQRDGSLGFVRDDGSTDVPELRVAKELYEAADRVTDGQLVPTPIAEAGKFAVVWRKGTRPERAQTLQQERDNIREILIRTRAQAARAALVDQLRKARLSAYDPGELPEISLSATAAASSSH
jgi:peptidyl-prolyl cis-trans isomerase C